MSAHDRLKVLLGLKGSDDELIALLLAEAEEYIIGYTRRKSLPAALIGAQVRLAAMYYNRRGIEGERRMSEGSVSHEVEALPSDIERVLNQHRVAKVVCMSAVV